MEDELQKYDLENRGKPRGKLECGFAQPSLFLLFFLFFFPLLFKTPEGIIVGQQNFAWAPKSQKRRIPKEINFWGNF